MAENDKKNPSDLNNLKARLGLKNFSGPESGMEETQTPILQEKEIKGVSSPISAEKKFPSDRMGEQRDFTGSSSAGGNFPVPEYVIPSDSTLKNKPLSAKKLWLFLGLGFTGIVCLVIGLVFGSVFDARSRYHRAKDQSNKFIQLLDEQKVIIDQISKARKELEAPGEKKIFDEKQLDILKKIDWSKLDQNREEILTLLTKADLGTQGLTHLFRHYYFLEMIHQQVDNQVAELERNKKDLQDYAQTMAAQSDEIRARFMKKEEKEKPLEFGLLMVPKDSPRAQLVQIVSTKCEKAKDAKASKEGTKPEAKVETKPESKVDDKTCAPSELKISFRMQPGGQESQTPSIISTEEGGIIPVMPTELSKSLLVGDLKRLAYQSFKVRNADLAKTIQQFNDNWTSVHQWLEKFSKK